MSDIYETMMLISQAVKSNLPLGEAIRLSIIEGQDVPGNKALLRFASLLDQGIEPARAVRQAGLPKKVALLLEPALESGDFANYLAELAEMERSKSETTWNLLHLMAYPILIFLIWCAVAILFMVLVIPQFDSIYRDFDTELPMLTVCLISLSKIASQPQTYTFLGVVLIVFFLFQQLFVAKFWYYVPVLGSIFWSLSSLRVLRQLALSLNRHVPLDEALKRCGRSFRNIAFRSDCFLAAEEAKNGTKLSAIISMFPFLFPAWLAPIVQTAEKNDSLPRALYRGCEMLEEQKQTAASLFAGIFTPLVFILFLPFIAFIVVSLFLPLIKLITTLSG